MLSWLIPNCTAASEIQSVIAYAYCLSYRSSWENAQRATPNCASCYVKKLPNRCIFGFWKRMFWPPCSFTESVIPESTSTTTATDLKTPLMWSPRWEHSAKPGKTLSRSDFQTTTKHIALVSIWVQWCKLRSTKSHEKSPTTCGAFLFL